MTATPVNVIAITDCGSTTTKAILIERIDGRFRMTARGDAPTTVEEPEQDVTRGVLNALTGIGEMRGRSLVVNDVIVRPASETGGLDLYLSTSSAGGGLQMMVAGVVRKLSAKAAERAALGAGAIVSDVIAFDDDEPLHLRMERIRAVRPDMVLLGGGTEGGAATQVIEMAELLATADPKPRFGDSFKLPVIFAGNSAIVKDIEQVLGSRCALYPVDNLLAAIDRENLEPARERVHELFLDHVMRQAPGFGKLDGLTDHAVVPTPSAVGGLLEQEANTRNQSILCVDIGGATTDVFSVGPAPLNRTVSANLGMSYSATNVLMETGFDNVARWLPFSVSETELTDIIMNKTVRPTTVPSSLRELLMEQALAREALRLALAQHLTFIAEGEGGDERRLKGKAEKQAATTIRDMDLIIGSGGVISHAPRPAQAALMLMDGFLPEGVTHLTKDDIFMMPHLGVLSRVMPGAAHEVFENDCLKDLGSCIAPTGRLKARRPCLRYEVSLPGGAARQGDLSAGELRRIPLGAEESAGLVLRPARGLDVGAGPGRVWSGGVRGGSVGLLLDGRGRPLVWPNGTEERIGVVRGWLESIGALEGIKEPF